MAQSQIRQPSQEELLRAFTAGQTPFDPTQAARGVIQGEDLASTILKNKQAQEDRVRALADKIAQAKKEANFVKNVQAGPVVTSIVGKPVTASETIQGVQPEDKQLGDIAAAFPKETALDLLKERIQNKSEAGKLERAQLRQNQQNTSPDKIKQLFQVGDKVMGVTYGGAIRPIDVPGNATLRPLDKTLPAEQVEKTANFKSLQDLINRVKANVTDEKTGQLSEASKSRLGAADVATEKAKTYIPGQGDPKSTELYQTYQDLQNQIVYLRSGKQINEAEAKRLSEAMPSIYKQDTFVSDLANFEKTFNQIMSHRENEFKRTGYYVPEEEKNAGNPGKSTGFRVISVRPSGSK